MGGFPDYHPGGTERINQFALYHTDVAAVTNHEIRAAPTAGSGRAIHIVWIVYNTAVAGTMYLKDEAGTIVFGLPGMAANGGCSCYFKDSPKILAVEKALQITTTGAGTWAIEIGGYTE